MNWDDLVDRKMQEWAIRRELDASLKAHRGWFESLSDEDYRRFKDEQQRRFNEEESE